MKTKGLIAAAITAVTPTSILVLRVRTRRRCTSGTDPRTKEVDVSHAQCRAIVTKPTSIYCQFDPGARTPVGTARTGAAQPKVAARQVN